MKTYAAERGLIVVMAQTLRFVRLIISTGILAHRSAANENFCRRKCLVKSPQTFRRKFSLLHHPHQQEHCARSVKFRYSHA